jgi:hypothetical protein
MPPVGKGQGGLTKTPVAKGEWQKMDGRKMNP